MDSPNNKYPLLSSVSVSSGEATSFYRVEGILFEYVICLNMLFKYGIKTKIISNKSLLFNLDKLPNKNEQVLDY